MAKYTDDEDDEEKDDVLDSDVAPLDSEDLPEVSVPESTEPDDEDTDKELNDSEDIAQNEVDKKSPEAELKDESNKALEDLDQEQRQADALAKLSSAPERKPANDENKLEEAAIAKPSNPQLSKYQNFINEYKRLQDQRRKGDLVNGLIAAGGKIGQSIAGANSGEFNPDQSGNQMLAKMNERPVQDFEQAQVVQSRGIQLKGEMDSHDPNSPQSKMVRDYINQRLGMNLGPDVSAADAQMLLKTVGRPVNTKFQKVNGTWTDPATGKEQRMSASYDPGMGMYVDPLTKKPLPGFLAEGLNPFQVVKGEHGENTLFNKSRGKAPTALNEHNNFNEASSPNEIVAQLTPKDRDYLQKNATPAFNKATEKTRQRLTHVPVIMRRLKEAQTNPAALPQLKAELARFDVGDQRLAQQEFDMFAKRMGYKGFEDWINAHSTGTINADFADGMAKAVQGVSDDLEGELSKEAEKQATLVSNNIKGGQKIDPKLLAPAIYGGYKPVKKKVMRKGYNPKTDKTQLIYEDGSKEIVNGRQ